MANDNWCAVCGWSLAIGDDPIGCSRGNCSRRPLPQYFTDPDRAIAEGYDPELVERHRRPPPPPCPECERLTKERDAALAERDEARAWIRKASGWPISHERNCLRMIPKEPPLHECDCGLDEFLAGGEAVKAAAMAPLDAALATAQARDEEAARLRAALVRAKAILGPIEELGEVQVARLGPVLDCIDAALGSPR